MGASVALVGLGGQQDNLGLGYLAAYVESRGHRAEIFGFVQPSDMPRCVEEISKMNPDMVGLGISFQFAIPDFLSLAGALRQNGYVGHITCGGHVPTFCYTELLAESPSLDSAVRHEGEHTLCEMLDSIARNAPMKNIHGLVWREGTGSMAGPPRPFVRNLDTLPWPKRNPELFKVAGFPVSFVIASRGCIGDCAYCVIRAFSKDAGGPNFRLRDVFEVAKELAYLRQTTGARLVMLEDDLFILPSQRKSIDRMNRLHDALQQLGIDDLHFWIKARPETITPAVLDAARRLGVGQIFLGVEQVSEVRLQYLGRVHTPADNRVALSLLKQYDIQPCFNLMMFDPDCTIDEVDAAIAFAREYADVPWNICRTEIYPGTAIHKRLQASGRLTGDFIRTGYTMTDPVCELMFRIVRVAFFHRSFNVDSLINRMATLMFALEAIRRIRPCTAAVQHLLAGRELLQKINRDTANRLKIASDFARSAGDASAGDVQLFAMNLAMDMNDADHKWHLEIDARFKAVEQINRT